MAANKLTLSLRAYTLQDGSTHPSSLKRRGSWIGTTTFEVRNDQLESDGSLSGDNSFELSGLDDNNLIKRGPFQHSVKLRN